MNKSGSCLCGAVTYDIENAPNHVGACHCGSCRKWSGGVYIGVACQTDQVTLRGEDKITLFASSVWAERGFCSICGSSLFYRVTAPGPYQGAMHFGLGGFDDPSGMTMTEEIFIDRKPDGYRFAGETDQKTEQEMMALFAAP